MRKDGKIGDLPQELVQPAIVTGVDALGRGNDVQKLDELLAGSLQMFGEQALSMVHVGEYLSRKASALGIQTEGLIKTDEEAAEEQNQAMMQQTAQSVAPQVVSGIAQNAQQ
jgi:hypothetical protein